MKKANPKVIGAFVVGAVLLLVAGLLAFGSGKAFEERVPFVMVFQESLGGLNVGSPVTFNGVTVGEVTDIRIEYDIETLSVVMPVFAEILPSRIVFSGGERIGSRLEALTEKGFRAQLVSQSLVTGQLAVELDFHPDTEAHLSGGDYGVPEVATIKSGLASLKETISSLPVEQLMNSAIKLINNLDEIAESPQVKESLTSMAAGLQSFRDAMAKVDKRTDPLLNDLEGALTDTREAIESAKKAIEELRGNAADFDTNLETTLAKFRQVLDDLDQQIAPLSQSVQDAAGSVGRAFDSADSLINQNSKARRNLETALASIAEAAKAIEALAEELERNPEALIRGRR